MSKEGKSIHRRDELLGLCFYRCSRSFWLGVDLIGPFLEVFHCRDGIGGDVLVSFCD